MKNVQAPSPILPHKFPFRVASLFSEKGSLSTQINNYVERKDQIDFANVVSSEFI